MCAELNQVKLPSQKWWSKLDPFNWQPTGHIQPTNQLRLACPWVQNTTVYLYIFNIICRGSSELSIPALMMIIHWVWMVVTKTWTAHYEHSYALFAHLCSIQKIPTAASVWVTWILGKKKRLLTDAKRKACMLLRRWYRIKVRDQVFYKVNTHVRHNDWKKGRYFSCRWLDWRKLKFYLWQHWHSSTLF